MIGIYNGPGLIRKGKAGSLKRDLLFFEKLELLGANEVIDHVRSRTQGSVFYELANEIEYLLETPFFGASSSEDVLSALYEPMENRVREDLEAPREWFQNINISIENLKKKSEKSRVGSEILDLRAIQASLITRLEAERLSHDGELATSNEPMPIGQGILGLAPCAGDVIQLAINQVPVPDELTPWEEVFAIRSDKDVVDRARKLRLWSVEQTKSGYSLRHLEEMIADRLSDYENSLSAHKIKLSRGVLRSAVVGTAGLIEDVVKFRFERAAERLFSVQTSRADMLLAEANAPGRELSLVTLLRDRFRRS